MSDDRVVCPWCEGDCMISASYPNPSDIIERQSKLIDELVEALEPFAKDASDWDQDWIDKARQTLSKAQSHKPNEGQRDESVR